MREAWKGGMRQRWRDENDARDALRMVRGEQQPPLRAHRERHQRRAWRVRRIEHGQRVGHILFIRVGRRVRWAIRLAVAAPIEGDDAVVARQIGYLHLP